MIDHQIVLEDTTLRDGEQAPGVAFNMQTKLQILDLLLEAGVNWIEAGIPAMGGSEVRCFEAMLERVKDSGAMLFAWNRGVEADIDRSISLGFTCVHIGLPTSDTHISNSIQKDRRWVVEKASDLIKHAKDKGAFVSISAEDVGRSDTSFLIDYAGAINDAGADRIRLSDTIGILTPEKYSTIVRSICEAVPIDLQCHTHNDFGLAVANTIAGLEAGAKYFHVTVNGIGERAGMPDFAQVVMALKLLYNVDLGINTMRLRELSELVYSACCTTAYPWQPIVGESVFSHESGIHVNGTLRDEKAFEPFSPQLVNGNRRIVIGKHSGKAALEYALKEIGVEPNVEKIDRCLYLVREISMIKSGALTYGELEHIYSSLSSH